MKIITILGLAFLIPMMNSLVRINIWHDKLKQLCFSRGDALYQDIINRQQSLSSHLASFHVKNLEYSSQMQECQKDNNSKFMLELLVDAVQLCIDEEDRLQKDQKEVFIFRLLEVVCQLHVLGGGKIHDPYCMNSTKSKLNSCRHIFHEFQTILLPLIYNTEECREARKLLDCLKSGISDCNETIRYEYEAALNVTFYTLYGCPQVEEIFDSSNIEEEILARKTYFDNEPIEINYSVTESSKFEEDMLNINIVSESQPIVRFNFSKIELKEKCNQKADILLRAVESCFMEFLSVKAEKMFSIASEVKSLTLRNKKDLHSVLTKHCYNDIDLRSSMEKLYNAVEQCIEEEERFDEDRKAKLLVKSLEKFCSGPEITASLVPNDQECFYTVATFFKLALCSRNNSVEHDNFANLPLLFVSSPEECSNLYHIQSCKLKVHEECKNSTKDWLQEQFNQERKFSGCEDIIYNSTFADSLK